MYNKTNGWWNVKIKRNLCRCVHEVGRYDGEIMLGGIFSYAI